MNVVTPFDAGMNAWVCFKIVMINIRFMMSCCCPYIKLSLLGKKIQYYDILKYSSYICQIISFDISCKLSLEETICMKCQSLLYGKNKKFFYQFVVC